MTTAIFDLDRTLTRHGTWTPFLLSVLRRRPGRWIAAAALVPVFIRCAIGRIDRKRLKEASMRAILAGESRAEIDALSRDFIDRIVARGLRPGAIAAVERHRAAGHRLMVATASMDFYAVPLARRLGIDSVVATNSCWTDQGRLRPAIEGENIYGRAKFDAVTARLCDPDPPQTRSSRPIVMYSDHISDFPLLRWADRGVVVNPKRRTRKAAREAGLEIVDWSVSAGAGDRRLNGAITRTTPAR